MLLDSRPFAGHRAWSLRSDRKLKSFLLGARSWSTSRLHFAKA